MLWAFTDFFPVLFFIYVTKIKRNYMAGRGRATLAVGWRAPALPVSWVTPHSPPHAQSSRARSTICRHTFWCLKSRNLLQYNLKKCILSSSDQPPPPSKCRYGVRKKKHPTNSQYFGIGSVQIGLKKTEPDQPSKKNCLNVTMFETLLTKKKMSGRRVDILYRFYLKKSYNFFCFDRRA